MTDTETERRSIALAAGKALRAARGKTADEAPPEPPGEDATETAANETPVGIVEAPVETEASDEIAESVEASVDADASTEHEADWVEITGQTETEADPESAEAAPRRPPVLLITASVTLALALAFAVVAGVLWWRAEPSAGRTLAAQRDAVLRAARVDVATMNTSDYRNPQAAIDQWLSVTTGTLHDQLVRGGNNTPQMIKDAKMITTAVVEAAAVTAFDDQKGTATVMLSVNVNHRPVSGTTVPARNRLTATMTRVNGVWLLSDLSFVSVQLS